MDLQSMETFPSHRTPKSQTESSPLQDGKPYGKHAVWIGNIPETLTTEELEQIFQGFGFVSAFVVMKHKCAFVNFDDWDECTRSIASLNGKEYRGRKLAVRLRNEPKEKKMRMSAQAPPIVRTTGVSLPSPKILEAPRATPSARPTLPSKESESKSIEEQKKSEVLQNPEEKVPVRYFIMKTQSQQDLESAVARGYWASSTRNEGLLDEAFLTTEVVYLVFSVNQSGEFFGLAKMMSQIGVEESDITWATVAQPSSPKEPAHPDLTSVSQEDNIAEGSADLNPEPATESSAESKAFGDNQDDLPPRFPEWARPFGIQWLSLKRIPFSQTKHLHNPWNENKEVKVSRDGTELEPSIGAQLVGLFLDQSSNTSPENSRSASPPSVGDGSSSSSSSPTGARYPLKASPNGVRRNPRSQEYPAEVIPGAYSPYMVPPFQNSGYPYSRPYIQYYPYQSNSAPNMKGGQPQYAAGGFYHNGLFVANSNFIYPYLSQNRYWPSNVPQPVYGYPYGQYPASWRPQVPQNHDEEQPGEESQSKAERNTETKGTDNPKETSNQQIEQAA